MVLGIVLLTFLLVVMLVYLLLFKEYSELTANFETLVKVIETRDLLLMRILPEIKNKKVKDKMTELISNRVDAKRKGNDAIVEADVKINKNLKPIYDELNNSKNPIVKAEFQKIIKLEKKLKIIRREYNSSVEKYNNKISKRPKLYILKFHMKPLNTYDFKE